MGRRGNICRCAVAVPTLTLTSLRVNPPLSGEAAAMVSQTPPNTDSEVHLQLETRFKPV